MTGMNNENGSDLIIAVVFAINTQLGRIGPKDQDLVISFHFGEEETFPQSHLRDLQIISENFLLQYQTGKITNLTGNDIMEP